MIRINSDLFRRREAFFMERVRGSWVNVPENLKCMTDLKEMGLKPTG
jgi:hypothetical protein